MISSLLKTLYMNKLIRIAFNEQKHRYFFSYFVPLFTLSTLPSLQLLFKVSLLDGWISLISTTSIILLYVFTLFYILRFTINIFLDKKRKLLIFFLVVVLTSLFLLTFLYGIFFQGYPSFSLLKNEFLLWFMYTGRYLFLSLFFLANPYPLFQQVNSFNSCPEDRFPKSFAILLNALILPLTYTFFGTFHNGLLYVGLQDFSENELIYNNYLFISDSYAFNNFILLLAFPTLISIFFSIYSTYYLSLIGSRISTLSSVLFLTFSILVYIFFNLRTSIKYFFKSIVSLKKGWNIKILTCFFVILSLIAIFFADNHEADLTKFSQSLFSSRVGESLFEFEKTNDKLEDESFSARISLFQCHLDNFFSKPDIMIVGQPWEESGCTNYIHSGLSVLFEQGIGVFLILILTIYLCIVHLLKFASRLKKQIKKKSEISKFYLLLVFLVTFSLISIFARRGLGYFLPAYIFCYSVTTQMKRSSDN
jgi:hypothetical protein